MPSRYTCAQKKLSEIKQEWIVGSLLSFIRLFYKFQFKEQENA